jgi:hypothetical protein
MTRKRKDLHRRRRAVDTVGYRFTPKGLQILAGLYEAMETTEPGRAALDLGAGYGSMLRPCPTHAAIECEPCATEINRLVIAHLEITG